EGWVTPAGRSPASTDRKIVPRSVRAATGARCLGAALSRSPVDWLARTLSIEAKDKLIDFDASRPGCGHPCKSPLSCLPTPFCLNAERASPLYNVGVHWSPVWFPFAAALI